MKSIFSILIRTIVYYPLLSAMDILWPTTTTSQNVGHLALFILWAIVTEQSIIATARD